jgi:leader peptidase (prepilin peptidase)/N-methyltransferase
MPPLIALPATVVGLCLGSFVATAALRAAHGEQALAGRSHCDGCGASLGFARTMPVLSYVALRGACADCGGRIDPLHVAGEVAGGLIVGAAFALAPWSRALPLAALGLLLLADAIYDAKSRKLPDLLTLGIAALGVALAVEQSMATLWLGLIAAAAAFVLLEAVRRGFLWARRKPGLGFGDVKLVAALAVWLGLATPWAVAVASILALGVALARPSADGRLAFGPWLALGGFSVGMIREAHLWPALS